MLSRTLQRVPKALPRGSRGMAVIHSKFPDVELPKEPLTEYILKTAHKYGDSPAFTDGLSGRTIKYSELGQRVGGAAEALAAMGFGDKDVLNIHLPNTPEYCIAFNAAAALGGVASTSNPMYTTEELHRQLVDSGAKVLLTAEPFKAMAEAAAEGTKVQRIVLAGSNDDFTFAPGVEFQGTVQRVWDDPAAATVAMPYSSGTTGPPKGTMLSHLNLTSNVSQISDHPEFNLNMRPGDNVLGLLPFQHIYGMVVVMLASLRAGGNVVTLPKFEPKMFLEAMVKHRISWAPLVPPIILFLAKHPMVKGLDMSALRVIFSGAAPLDKETQAAAAERLGGGDLHVLQGYGMTEMSPVSHFCHPGKGMYKSGSVGFLVPNAQARLVDPETGEDVPEGPEHAGELWFKGPNVMQGYLGREQATADTLTPDGWLKTGDLVSVDEDGHFFVRDRLKELIKCKGFQVAPAELEGLLLKNPHIADAAVIPIPHPRNGEAPLAFVVRADTPEGKALTEDSVKAFMEPHIADYKQLDEVRFVDSIPKSASGKILRRVLRDQERAERQRGSA